LKLFFEAGTVGAADESVGAPRRARRSEKAATVPAAPASKVVKPMTMEWDEWTLAFQGEPVVIDYEGQPTDDAPTTLDLVGSAARVGPDGSAEQEEPMQNPKPRPTSHERLRTLERSFIDGTKRTL